MAFNIQTFKTRALTAVVFVLVMLAGLFTGHWTFLILFSIIHFGCWFEYQKLIGLIDPDYRDITAFHKYGVMIAGWSFMLWMTSNIYSLGNITLHEIGWWLMLIFVIALPLIEILLSKNLFIKNIGYSFLGLLYISLSWGLLVNLRSMYSSGLFASVDIGLLIPLLIIFSIWINDTMAYIVGSLIGKTPFSKISPKKTWEGTLGGAILAIATITLVGYYGFGFTDYVTLIVVSAIAAVFGTAGDLLESKLKRLAGVKDSGSLMPGHGGYLDRFDSLLLATPFVWLYVRFFILDY
ncbi:phosphatidate cytidylyltransferase [Foetidibacter luteolus]|uniref:phosphatidate cytidylyltransferase n=1 Tax=Foetidibacter luteolus TaxID=2608880 RepID=UPI00129A9C55|nr:phosphatidate cytidylyltransferase [Foetidibacter luteolus]